MVDSSKLFFQLMRIICGFIAAVIAAGLFFSWGYFRASGPDTDPIGFIAMTGSTVVSASMIGSLALIPAVFAVGFAETMRWKGVVYHVGAAGLIALAIWSIGDQLPSDGTSLALRPGSSIVTSAGFIAGFAYWLVAGRKSGCWWIGQQNDQNRHPR
ncbi:translation initiation factor 3 [Pseudovibrio sp. SPO723]|uniref:translation initiation factor 3 n=1 Tax=Nesiotobacter zosterae TaxID=392721 RepID=UPI0029C58778|nr:translation initiation factor 3 [Pseudovibrio sp. SPO723]MDX5594950.1 translation initiation factor 3 [Pseudovibrio sp. SPO723]